MITINDIIPGYYEYSAAMYIYIYLESVQEKSKNSVTVLLSSNSPKYLNIITIQTLFWSLEPGDARACCL